MPENNTADLLRVQNNVLFNQIWGAYQPHGMLWALEQRYKHILPILSNYGIRDRLVDFGCGDGSFIHTIKRLGLSVRCVGIDSSVEALSRARGNTSSSYASEVSFTSELAKEDELNDGITIVTALHVLEHVGEPLDMLKKMGSAGDIVLVEVPIEGGLVERLKAWRMSKKNGNNHPWGHINFWKPKSFTSLVNSAGLVPIYYYEYSPTLYGESNPFGFSTTSLKRSVKKLCWNFLPRFIYREIYSSFFFIVALPVNVGQGMKTNSA